MAYHCAAPVGQGCPATAPAAPERRLWTRQDEHKAGPGSGRVLFYLLAAASQLRELAEPFRKQWSDGLQPNRRSGFGMILKPRRPRCLVCNRPFIPDPRSRHHQRHCSRVRCQKASKAASQKRWAERVGYWRGSVNSDRVRAWRAKNPGYWKRGRKRRRVRYKKT